MNYGVPQVQYLANLASSSTSGGGGGITTVPNTGTDGYPITSGLTSNITGGNTLYLQNTVLNFDNSAGSNVSVTLSGSRQCQYLNIISKHTGGSAVTFTYILPATATTPSPGAWMSLHIDNGGSSPADTFSIVYQTKSDGTTSTQAATVGSTYTFMCFTSGVWTKM